ncbi:MAG: hypothetical protein IT456_24960 [Planctomycetes bacterium]|jgi:hypothetical protein|nr:hypothetical protein [Planctomycetota bacterium]
MALAKGIAGSNFYAMINGQAGGYLKSAQTPSLEVDKIALPLGPDGITKQAGGRMKLGDCKVVMNVSEANGMWQLIESVMKKNCQEFESVIGVADHNYKSVREIEMMTCLMKEVSFPTLKAESGKELFEVTATWMCQDIKYSNGSGSVIKGNLSNKAKGWHTCYFDPIGVQGGIAPQAISSITLCKHTAKIVQEHLGMQRRPTLNYAAWTVEGLAIEGSAAYGGYEAARDLAVKLMYDGVLQESEFHDWSVNIKDPSHKNTVGEVAFIQTAPYKFTTGAESKGGEDKPIQWKLDLLCEGQQVTISQKA